MGKFQALGGVNGHHDHRIVPLVVLLQIGVQGNFFQKAREAGLCGIGEVGLNAGLQFLHVFQLGLVFLRRLGQEHIGIARADKQLIIEFRQAHAVCQKPCQVLDQCGELQQLLGRFFQRAVIIGVTDYLIDALSLGLGQLLDGLNGLGPQASGGIVDDAVQAQVVCPVVDDAQIGQHILDFGSLKEAHTADDPVGNAVAFQGIFHGVGLGVGPVQNSVILEVVALGAGKDLAGNEVALGPFVLRLIYENGLPCAVVRPQVLALPAFVVGDDGVGRIQNGLSGAVVLLQPNDPGTWVLLFKGENILNGSAPEAVNALVVITDYADVPSVSCQQLCQKILDVVGILVLVHQNIMEFPLVVFPYLPVLLQELHGDIENVVKIQGVVVLQALLIDGVDLGDLDNAVVRGAAAVLLHLLRGNQPVLLPADDAQYIPGRIGLVIQVHVPENFLHEPLGVRGIVDGKAGGIAAAVNIPAQNAAAGGMEGHGPDILGTGPQHIGKPLLHLSGGLVGKGNGDDVPGVGRLQGAEPVCPVYLLLGWVFRQVFQERHILVPDKVRNFCPFRAPAIAQNVGDSVDEHRGLAAAGTCQQQKRPLGGQHGLPLHIVEHGKAGGNVVPPSGQKSGIQFIIHRSTCHFCLSFYRLLFYRKEMQKASRLFQLLFEKAQRFALHPRDLNLADAQNSCGALLG